VARAAARRAAPVPPAHIHRSGTWHGLKEGDPVVIDGVRLRGATWVFRAHVVNERNGTESVEVVGGRKGDRAIRSFDPGRVYPVTGRRSRSGRPGPAATATGLSLDQAPQLPLG
jgi:hypothetical protein